MSSPLGDLVARVFDEVPRLRFNGAWSRAEARAWANELLLVVQRHLDHAGEIRAEIVEEGRIGGFASRALVFRLGTHVRFGATLLRPRSQETAGTILVLPGRNARHQEVIGIDPPDWPDRNVAERLTRAGFATLTIDYGLREALAAAAAGRDETSLLAHALALQGRSLLGCLASDARAAVCWLEEQPEVDSATIGLLGQSLGGHVALHVALAHSRRLPTVLASCAGTYRSIFWRDLSGGGAHALPGIFRHADLPDLMGALAPGFLQI